MSLIKKTTEFLANCELLIIISLTVNLLYIISYLIYNFYFLRSPPMANHMNWAKGKKYPVLGGMLNS